MLRYVVFFTAVLYLISGCHKAKEIKPERKDIVDAVFASGNIITKNEYQVTANSEGFLKDALVSEGDSVQPGQALFHVFNDVQQSQVQNASVNYNYAKTKAALAAPQIQQLQIQIKQAQIQAATDSVNFLRYQRLIKTKAVSQADYDKAQLQYQASASNVQALQQSLADLQVTLSQNTDNAKSDLIIQKQNNQYNTVAAAAAGKVLNVYKKPGDYVKKGEAIATIGTGPILMKLYIAEDDIDRVKVGQSLLVSLNTEKDTAYNATVSKIYPSFDDSQQAFIAEATFTQLPPVIKSNTQLQANIIVGEKKNALVVPSVYIDKSGMVTLKNGDKREVKVGIRNLEWAEILQGLNDDETIIMPK